MTATKTLTVAEAIRRRDEATRRLEDLTAKVKGGDPSVTQDQLNDARDAAEFAELQIEGAKAAEHRQRDEELRALCEEFRPQAQQRISDHLEELGGLADEARHALRRLLDGIDRTQEVKAAIRSDHAALRPDWIGAHVEHHELPPAYRRALPIEVQGTSELDKVLVAAGLLHEQLSAQHVGNWKHGTQTNLVQRLRDTTKAAYDSFTNQTRPT